MTHRTHRPNILMFLTDDHAGWAMHCAGTTDLHTPSMDHIAHSGIRFSRASCVSPVCSPARASFWTGTLPSWHGVHDHIAEDFLRDHPRLTLEDRHPGIGDQPTLAEALQAVGYRTGLVGKWHCHCSPHWRKRPGFDRWFSQDAGTNARFGPQPFNDQETVSEHHCHQAPIIGETALDFLRTGDERPFFLCVGMTDTHSPFRDGPQRLVEHYRHRGLAWPIENMPTYAGLAKTPAPAVANTRPNAEYAAAVTHIDEQVGRMLDELDAQGLREDTIIIYTADHGHLNGRHGLMCKGNATCPQNLFEESVEIPLVACGPGIGAGTISDAFVDHCDTHQTILALAGAAMPDADTPRPGCSWLPLARGEETGWRTHRFCEYGNARSVRDERWKLIRRWPGPNGHFPDVLIDLQTDPRETTNRIDDPGMQAVRQELSKLIDEHFTPYQRPGCDGRRVAEQPLHNQKEPWRSAVPTEIARA